MNRTKIEMTDLIVLLPGITGSILRKDGKDLWSPSFGAIFGAATSLGRNLAALNLVGDDPEIEDLGDGITVGKLIPDAVIVPGLIKIDGYTQLSEMIRNSFNVTEGSNLGEKHYPPANYFEFAYDWRRDNRVAAQKLKQLIDVRLSQWQEYAGPKAKVILIAHSMGGLIARYYLEVLGGREKCKVLITLGTPYGGSLKALDFLANGYSKYLTALSNAMATFTSVYQLLPLYKAVNTDDGFANVSDINLEGVSRQRVQEAFDFHYQIMDEVDARIQAGNKEPYVTLPVVGTYQPTLQSADLYQEKLTVSEILPPDFDRLLWHGDGTVPYLSATPHELQKSLRNSFFAETHGALQCSDDVLEFIYEQLLETQIKHPSFRGTLGTVDRVAISVHIEDLYSSLEPIVIHARLFRTNVELSDRDSFQDEITPLRATFERVDSADHQVVQAVFIKNDSGWTLELAPLPPGIYRVEVRAAREIPTGPSPVHDLFEVVAPV